MKEKYYYIGEVSSLLDISTQTLRYYDKIGLVRPAKVNERTAIASIRTIRFITSSASSTCKTGSAPDTKSA